MKSRKMKGMRIFNVIFLVAGIIAGSFFPANAQDDAAAKVKVSAAEEKALQKIESSKTIAEKIKATDEFIKKYPQSPARSQAAGYLAAQITQLTDESQIVQNSETYLKIFTEPSEADLIMPSLIYSYTATKRHKDAYAAAEKYISRNPGDVAVRLQLASEGSNLVRTGTKDYAAVSRSYANEAIELIEADKKPADMDDEQWKEYQTKWLPQLYQSAGILDYQAGDKAKARVSLEKATKHNAADVNSWILLSAMTDDEYQELAQRYNITPAGAARDDLLKQASAKMDETIIMYARIVALTDGKPEAEVKRINEQVRQSLEQYYKFRHKNLDGLNELINKYK